MIDYNVHDINKFSFDICDILQIERMPVIRNKDMMQTETMLALYDMKQNVMFINPDIPTIPDLMFAICHELRHVWQNKINPAYYFNGYLERKETDIVTYNLQIAELDANAFAAMIMIEMLGLTPLFNGLEKNIVDKIMERKKKLTEEYFMEV